MEESAIFRRRMRCDDAHNVNIKTARKHLNNVINMQRCSPVQTIIISVLKIFVFSPRKQFT